MTEKKSLYERAKEAFIGDPDENNFDAIDLLIGEMGGMHGLNAARLEHAYEDGVLNELRKLDDQGIDITVMPKTLSGAVLAIDTIPLVFAASRGYLDIVKYLIETKKFKVDEMHNHALIYASMMGRLDVVKYLVENGADVTDINNSAVKYAARDGHLDVVKYLVEHGADVTDKNGMSMNVLQLAKYNKYNTQEMFDYLISHGATE